MTKKSISIEAERKTTTTIRLNLDGKVRELTEDEARAIWQELNKLFGSTINICESAKKEWNESILQPPAYPPQYPMPQPTTIPSWTITC